MTAALAIILLTGAGRAYCAAPDTLTYQGRLKESGVLVSGGRSVEIKLCPDETGNDVSCVTTGAQPVSVSSGLFRSTFTVPVAVDLNTGVWYVEIWSAGTQLAPRERLTSAAYSIYATTATGLAAAPNTAGAYVSTNIYITGISSAAAYYGDGFSLTNVSTHTFKIGDSYGGGKIFWVDSKSRQVLIAATADQSSGIKWSNNSTATGAGQDGVYAGKANTVIISTMQRAGSYAAQLCSDYSVTVNGEYYDDWYLPSESELSSLYTQKDVVGGFTTGWYWSSKEYSPLSAYFVKYDSGIMNSGLKSNLSPVRCVRAGPSTPIGNIPTNFETVTNGAYITSTQTFSGSNTFKDITAATVTVTGDARLARNLTQAANTGITLPPADFGKTITIDNAAAQTVNLPAVTAADIGATITVIKLNSGKVTIDAPLGNFIADSADGGIIYNDAFNPPYAAITLRFTSSFRWVMTGGSGSWLTDTGTEYALGCTAGNCGGLWRLPDTGQTVCYDNAGGVIVCPAPEAALAQDGSYVPTAVQPAYTVYFGGVETSSYTVDNITGRMWVTNPNDMSGGQYVSSGTWTWEQAIARCEGLTYAGYSDWRLPNIKELQSIADYSRQNPSINTTYFLNTQSDYYWSSTTYVPNTTIAWNVGFNNGSMDVNNKTVTYYVRCVRGGP